MKVLKFEKYLQELDGCLTQVEVAMKNGAMLTEMELMDYYFKRILLTDEESGLLKEVFGERAYRLANFLVGVLNEVQDLKVEGYTNYNVYDVLKSICVHARLTRLTSTLYSVHTYDYNGMLYVDFYKGSRRQDTLCIRNLKDVVKVVIAVASFLATESLEEGELKTFVAGYLLGVYNEIANFQSPKPYIYTGLAKTLKNYIGTTEDAKPAVKERKIVEFRVG